MRSLKSSVLLAILSLATVIMVGNAHGQMSDEEAGSYYQQYREDGVVHNILIVDKQMINVTVGTDFQEMTPMARYDFAVFLSRAHAGKITSVTDAFTGEQFLEILGTPEK